MVSEVRAGGLERRCGGRLCGHGRRERYQAVGRVLASREEYDDDDAAGVTVHVTLLAERLRIRPSDIDIQLRLLCALLGGDSGVVKVVAGLQQVLSFAMPIIVPGHPHRRVCPPLA